MLHFAIALRQPIPNLFRIVFERAVPALIGNVPVLINHVKPFRPRGISIVRRIVHLIDAKRNGELVALRKVVRDRHALCNGLRLRIAHIVFFFRIGLHHPLVRRMSLAHVNRQKIGVFLIVFVKLRDVANLATERRSSKAAENQHQRPPGSPFANVKYRAAI